MKPPAPARTASTAFTGRMRVPFVAVAAIALTTAACGSDNASRTATASPATTSSPPAASAPAATRTPAGLDPRTPTALPAAPTAAVTVIATASGATLPGRPPIARAIAGSSSVEMTRGSSFWNGVHADATHVITSTDRLMAAPGATIVVTNPAPLPLASAGAGFVAATDRPRTTEAGMLEWPYAAFTRAGVATIAGDEVQITAPPATGTYVGTLFVQYAATDGGPASQAYYHFLLDVN